MRVRLPPARPRSPHLGFLNGADAVRFEVIDRISISSPTAAVNEDAAGATESAAWVIDGATGVSDLSPLVPGLTDAAWLAAQLDKRLHDTFEKAAVEPYTALAEIDADIRAMFSSTNTGPERSPAEQPTAAFALSVLRGDVVHLIGLGDCRIIVENRTGDVEEFDPSETGHAEASIIEERRRLLAAYPDEDPWPRLKPLIQSLRQFANAANGYSIVHPTLSWHSRVKRQVNRAQTIRHLLAMSDGLYRLVDVFKVFSSGQLLRIAVKDGLAPLCSQLRDLENADDRCVIYPRVKTHDDASAVLVTLTP
jgi:serine/threonine protein phosphatase PrpC